MSKPPGHPALPTAPRGRTSRFPDRSVRLRRQRESRVFRSFLMRPAWLAGVAGLAGVIVFGIEAQDAGLLSSAGLRASLAALVLPFLLAAVRFVRGHYSRDLDEP